MKVNTGKNKVTVTKKEGTTVFNDKNNQALAVMSSDN